MVPRSRYQECWACGRSRPPGGNTPLCGSCQELADQYDGVDESRIKSVYGIDAKFYGRLFARQKGRCFICRSRGPLVIDHDHKTGNVRGLLCNHCNSGLGFFRDDPMALRAAIDFLYDPPADYVNP